MIVLAKDGTNRGGARPGAGRKPKALAEKLATGNPGHRPLTMMDPGNMVGVDMPPPAEYLSAVQRDGKPLGADKIYTKVFEWLKSINCEKLVSPNMVEQYAICVKQANVVWADISQVVKENCSVEVKFGNPQDDMMEALLRRRNG